MTILSFSWTTHGALCTQHHPSASAHSYQRPFSWATAPNWTQRVTAEDWSTL